MIDKYVVKNIFILMLVFLVGFLYAFDGYQKYHGNGIDIANDVHNEGRYIKMIYIGSPSCQFSNTPENHDHMDFIKDYIRSKSDSSDLRFLSVGVSTGNNTNMGVKYLQNTGPYDQVVSGMGYYNIAAIDYVWESSPNQISTPQIVILIFTYSVVGTSTGTINNVSRKDSLIYRLEGTDEISSFYNSLKDGSQEIIPSL